MKAIVDCNSFYCACERLFRPDLTRRPVVVLSNNDGCIVSRTDEAKALGISMAVPFFQARPLIEQHQVATFSSNYALYGELSWRVMETMRQLIGASRVEVYSVDEAFLDLDGLALEPDVTGFLRALKQQIEQWTGIQVSIGAASTKVLSKVANRLAKKRKQETGCVLVLETPEQVQTALADTPVGEVWGIGRRYANQLREEAAVFTAADLAGRSEAWARKQLGGVVGARLWRELQGISSLTAKDPLTTKKMIATTRMFGQPVSGLNELREATATYTARAAEKLRRQHSTATFVQVFVVTRESRSAPTERFRHGVTKSAESILAYPTAVTGDLIRESHRLVDQLFVPGERYVKAGVMISGLQPDDQVQAGLFAPATNPRQRKLMDALDNINASMRDDVLRYAAAGLTRNWKMRQEHRSPRFTTRWAEIPIVR